jgi:hypothetical protein
MTSPNILHGRYCYAHIRGNSRSRRIGIVCYEEPGYYQTDLANESMTDDEVDVSVEFFNKELEMPEEVCEAMLYGSVFGWHVAAALPAHRHFQKVF